MEYLYGKLEQNGDETKANNDYNKRSGNSLGFKKKEVIYIAITTNVWANKVNWAKSKAEEAIWKNVIAYDSRDIAAWLENSPVSCRWFSILTKNHPYDGIYTADEYWKMLSIGPNGQFPRDYFLRNQTKSKACKLIELQAFNIFQLSILHHFSPILW